MLDTAFGPEPALLDFLHRRSTGDLDLAPPDRFPEILIDDSQFANLFDDSHCRRVRPGKPLAGLGVLDVALPIPDQAADVEFVAGCLTKPRRTPVGPATSMLRLVRAVPRARLAAKQQGLARKICLWARGPPWSDLTAYEAPLPHS